MASGRPIFLAVSRAVAMSSAFSSCVPCDMFIRTPLAPAAINFSTTSGAREVGPSVISIFAFLKIEPCLVSRSLSRSLQCSLDGAIEFFGGRQAEADQTFHELALAIENERLWYAIVISHQKHY